MRLFRITAQIQKFLPTDSGLTHSGIVFGRKQAIRRYLEGKGVRHSALGNRGTTRLL